MNGILIEKLFKFGNNVFSRLISKCLGPDWLLDKEVQLLPISLFKQDFRYTEVEQLTCRPIKSFHVQSNCKIKQSCHKGQSDCFNVQTAYKCRDCSSPAGSADNPLMHVLGIKVIRFLQEALVQYSNIHKSVMCIWSYVQVRTIFSCRPKPLWDLSTLYSISVIVKADLQPGTFIKELNIVGGAFHPFHESCRRPFQVLRKGPKSPSYSLLCDKCLRRCWTWNRC